MRKTNFAALLAAGVLNWPVTVFCVPAQAPLFPLSGPSSATALVEGQTYPDGDRQLLQAGFDSRDWSGSLESMHFDATHGEVAGVDWDAADVIDRQFAGDGHRDRVMMSWNPELQQGVAFRGDALDATALDLLGRDPETREPDVLGEARLAFLRGDTSRSTAEGGELRDRRHRLGDIVHSTPFFVGAPVAGHPDVDPVTGDAYTPRPYSVFARRFANSACVAADGRPIERWSAGDGGVDDAPGSREPVVYVGANDGALHGFSACTGEERLAYVPRAVFAHLAQLTSPDYRHRFYVDGAVNVQDAYLSRQGAWRSVLIGTLGAGGQGLFALDVTEPKDFSESNAAAVVLWEKHAGDPHYADLGYTFSEPVIVRARGHESFVAIFGNGYESASGKAVLYVVEVETGERLARLIVDDGPDNGLSTPTAIDRDADGRVDLVYAGDLKGNIWRIEPDDQTGFAGNAARVTRMFTAVTANGAAQAVTRRIAVGVHPLSRHGRMLYVGTGRFYAEGDVDPENALGFDSLYGLWDRDDGATIPSLGTARDSTVLQRQSIEREVAGVFGDTRATVRSLSRRAIDWVDVDGTCGIDGVCGWYLDLDGDALFGERVIADPLLRDGRLHVSTWQPLPEDPEGGRGWLMEIDPASGGAFERPQFDLSGDGVVDLEDWLIPEDDPDAVAVPVSGVASDGAIASPPVFLPGPPTAATRDDTSGHTGGGDGDAGDTGGAPGSAFPTLCEKGPELRLSADGDGGISRFAGFTSVCLGRHSWYRVE
jgi:type IV pilus assembly protein PilY1